MTLRNLIYTELQTSFTHMGVEVFVWYDEFRPNKIRVYLKNPYRAGSTIDLPITISNIEELFDAYHQSQEHLELTLIEYVQSHGQMLDRFVENSDLAFKDITRMIEEEEAYLAANPPVLEDEPSNPA